MSGDAGGVARSGYCCPLPGEPGVTVIGDPGDTDSGEPGVTLPGDTLGGSDVPEPVVLPGTELGPVAPGTEVVPIVPGKVEPPSEEPLPVVPGLPLPMSVLVPRPPVVPSVPTAPVLPMPPMPAPLPVAPLEAPAAPPPAANANGPASISSPAAAAAVRLDVILVVMGFSFAWFLGRYAGNHAGSGGVPLPSLSRLGSIFFARRARPPRAAVTRERESAAPASCACHDAAAT